MSAYDFNSTSLQEINSAAYRLMGSLQHAPCPKNAAFQHAGNHTISRHNLANPNDEIRVQFISSDSSLTLFEHHQFYAKHGPDVVFGNCHVAENDWPTLDTTVCAVISYGHSVDSFDDNHIRLEEHGQESEIGVSDGVTDLTN